MLLGKMLFLCLLICTAAMKGCAKPGDDAMAERFRTDYMEVFGGSAVRTPVGDFQVREGMIYFTDYAAKMCVPVCAKPDCRHLSKYEDRDTLCNAVYDGGLVFPYEGKLYRTVKEEGTRKSRLIASGMDGSNPKEVGTFSSGDFLQTAVIVGNRMYYVSMEMETNIGDDRQMPEMERIYRLCCFNLDDLEQREIVSKRGVRTLEMLGGTKDYQVYAVAEDEGTEYYLFDYETERSERISLNTNDYRNITAAQDGKSFYYAGDDGKKIYRYQIETGENEIAVDADALEAEKDEQAERTVFADAVCGEGLLFRIFPQNELYLYNGNGVRNLKLSQRLPQKAWLSGIEAVTKSGVYFTYDSENISEEKIDGDLLWWYAYIDTEDLLDGSGEIRVIHTPRVSSAGNIANIAESERER